LAWRKVLDVPVVVAVPRGEPFAARIVVRPPDVLEV
jgi:hypothetical protein